MSKKEQIIEKLKENGCRITKQPFSDRIVPLYTDAKIGVATVYRMINALEDIGAISRKNMYKLECSENYIRLPRSWYAIWWILSARTEICS